MKNLSYFLFFVIISFGTALSAYSQVLTIEQKDKITSEITMAFEKSIKAAESLDSQALADCVDDSMQAGFIVRGNFFRSFIEVMADFEENIIGCKAQKMNVTNKEITILGENSALLIASGGYSLDLEDGRTLTGKFTYTMVYSKMNGNWKIIHANM